MQLWKMCYLEGEGERLSQQEQILGLTLHYLHILNSHGLQLEFWDKQEVWPFVSFLQKKLACFGLLDFWEWFLKAFRERTFSPSHIRTLFLDITVHMLFPVVIGRKNKTSLGIFAHSEFKVFFFDLESMDLIQWHAEHTLNTY